MLTKTQGRAQARVEAERESEGQREGGRPSGAFVVPQFAQLFMELAQFLY